MSSFPDDAFLAAIPVQALPWEPGDEGRVVLLRPKLLSPRWTWVLRLIRRPTFRVRLDPRGTAVWQACDGARSVAEVARLVAERFPQETDTTSRTALFVRELALGGFVTLHQATVPDPWS